MKIENTDNKKIAGQKRRGKINNEDLNSFLSYSSEKLISMLEDIDAQKRTIAVKLLANKNNSEHIDILIKMFQNEKALYTRIAISESLIKYGKYSIPYLIEILGKIGNNQEKELPKKHFNKKSFPLPRDLAGRTLVKIGKLAIPFLIEVLEDENGKYNNFIKEQAIDAIGAIAYKYDDHRSLNSLIELSYKQKDNVMIQWKIIRALSGYKNNINALNQVIAILDNYYFVGKDEVCRNVVEIQWEAIRSINYIGIRNKKTEEIIDSFKENKNLQIQMALKNFEFF